ncbi:MAG TPA: Gfo/Idh/MocA family oxidoreductase [Lacipirellulaceae bacterium]|nr:Gfo/Idh/MocA family oxidoreductase [Lacipirellulaceae bacterium]
MNPLRVAVVGAGHLGRIHARIAAGLEEIELVAVADPVEEARNSVAHETHTRAVADYREFIGDVEAAIVATPTSYHHSIGMELLNCGVPLLVEKPLALTADQANDLVTLARQKNVALQVGHVERFNPALAAVAADVRDPKYIDATRTSGYTFRSTDIGVVLDVMIHDIDIVLSLAKSTVEDVQALGISVLGGHEDIATARLTFASGCVAQLSASRVSFQQQRTMSVFTSRGSASINFATHEAAVVKPCDAVLRREFRADQLSADERTYWKDHVFDKLLVRSSRDAQPVNAIQEEQRDFVAAVRTGRAPRVGGAAGRDAVAVAEMILERIEEHAWDGTSAGRHGPFAMPALPIIAGTTQPAINRQERRRAG